MKLKKKISINYLNLSNLYLKINLKNMYKKPYKLYFFSLNIHKKLHYFRFYFNNKMFTFSTGQILTNKLKLIKFFKKSRKSLGTSINILNKKLNKKLNAIYYFYCNNFNYKNYLWIKKFFYLIKPTIQFCIFTTNWNNIHKNKRRIKKKILKNLLKSSNII